jgi:predicted Zn-dependent protease
METSRAWASGIASAVSCVCATFVGATYADPPNPDREEAQLNANREVLHDPQLEAYLKDLSQRVIASDRRATNFSVRVHVFNDRAPAALALDNGAMYVSTGLLARLQNESQLAFAVACELAAAVRKDDQRGDTLKDKRAKHAAIGNALLITLTAGIAAFSVLDHELKAGDKIDAKVREESDRYALELVQRSGFDVNEAPRAFERLLRTQEEEGRLTAEVSRKSLLQLRLDAIKNGMPTPSPAPAVQSPDVFAPVAKRFALELALADLSSAAEPKEFQGVLDRYEREFGVDGKSTFLRAEAARRASASDADRLAAAQIYEKSTTFADVPVVAFRELGYLHRRQGELEKARESFAEYLNRAPESADAPIIRSYVERLK